MTTTKEQNRDLERELQSNAERFSNEFNFIDIDVVKTYLEAQGEELFDCIRQEEPDYSDFISNYGLEDEYKEYIEGNDLEDNEDGQKEFAEQDNNFDDWQAEQRDNNYPMWNTLFEFKHNPSEEILQAAIDSGFGVIESEYFNPMLFVSGAGYSFMAQHWIPFYLRLPWVNASKYTGVRFEHL